MARVVVVVVAVAALVGCTKPSDRFGGEGEGEADVESPCDGAELFVQTDVSNDTEDAALPIDSGGADLVMFGNTPDGTSWESLKGFFEVGGYAADQAVLVRVVDFSAQDTCATSGCPTTIGFRFFGTINVTNPDGTCGSTTVAADAAGVLAFKATGGGSGTGTGGGGGGGGGGPNGPDVGIRLTPQ